MKLHGYFMRPWLAIDAPDPGPVTETHFVTAGCSHTNAVGVDPNQGYTQLLANDFKIPGVNLSRPGGNHQVVVHNLTRWLREHSRNHRPKFVIVQWPHPLRKIVWQHHTVHVFNVHASSDHLFDTTLRYGEENFYYEWIESILTITTLCSVMNIPCVHWTPDEIDDEYLRILRDNDVVLHSNDENNSQWHRDSAAQDRQHHSEKCHAQWAEKLKGLINELTAR